MFSIKSLRNASVVALATAAMAPQAFATNSGTRITNTVTVDFEVGGVTQDQGEAETGFVVDRKIDMLVSDTGSITDGRPNQASRLLVYKVVNEGNDAQSFDIDVDVSGTLAADFALETAAGALTEGEYRVVISSDNTLDGGDTIYNPTGFTLANASAAYTDGNSADAFYVLIEMFLPIDGADTEAARFSVRATALNASNDGALVEVTGNGLDDAGTPANAVDIVFADGAKTTDSDGTDVIEDGKHTDNAQVTIASAQLTVAKSVTIISENTQGTFDCTTDADPAIADSTQGAIPGACLEYTITVSNGAASESASNLSISDTLEPGITFSAFTDVADWTTTNEAAGTISATLTTLAPNNSADLVFRVTVD